MVRKSLVIVESPTKAKVIGSFMPSDYEVVASYGHIRDLPVNKRDLPEKLRKLEMAAIGVKMDGFFTPIYIVPKEKKKVVAELKKKVQNVDAVLLATDEDREGESIGWHVVDELGLNSNVKRLAFHEISKKAVLEALSKPRSVDLNLVKAQEARRVLDRLYGYLVSPVLWRKISKGLSAGRVQSVALRLLVEREEERMRFVSAKYFTVEVKCEKDETEFVAKLHSLNGVQIATSKDFDPTTGNINTPAKLLSESEAREIAERISGRSMVVDKIEQKEVRLRTPSPFITSSLQQEANRRFGFSPKYTMNLAQKLYENGFITYMRTDSTTMSLEAISFFRKKIQLQFGSEYLSKLVKTYKSSVKNAQEAHEAIRPIVDPFRDVNEVINVLGEDCGKLYQMIVNRTFASQMEDAVVKRTTAFLLLDDLIFKSSGKVVLFDGYLRVYNNDLESEDLPNLVEGDYVLNLESRVKEHQTQPPSRYTEGSLVRELEKRGIGRPSTWASIVDLVTKREYAFKKQSALVPTFVSFAIVRLLKDYFPELIDYEFTANMEDDLDRIAKGQLDYIEFMNKFYFGSNGKPGLKTLLDKNMAQIDARHVC
ncbi:MAG: type I DNA topoisomerase, partial [Leptospiraceae bacterium]|nr:type I DNA topoisomerase [Leptospiraceae bacterium]